jgi:hypothetical protein
VRLEDPVALGAGEVLVQAEGHRHVEAPPYVLRELQRVRLDEVGLEPVRREQLARLGERLRRVVEQGDGGAPLRHRGGVRTGARADFDHLQALEAAEAPKHALLDPPPADRELLPRDIGAVLLGGRARPPDVVPELRGVRLDHAAPTLSKISANRWS